MVTVLSHDALVNFDSKLGALAVFTGSRNGTALALHNAFGHGQPNTYAVIGRICAFLKTIKNIG